MYRVSFFTPVLLVFSLIIPQNALAPIFGLFDNLENLCQRSSIIAVIESEGPWPTPKYMAHLEKSSESPDNYNPEWNTNLGGFHPHQVKLVSLIKGDWPEGNPVVQLRSGIGWLWQNNFGYLAEGDRALVFFSTFDSSENNQFAEDSVILGKNLWQYNQIGAFAQIEPSIDLTNLPKEEPLAAIQEILRRNIDTAPEERKEAAKLLNELYLNPELSNGNFRGLLNHTKQNEKLEAEQKETKASPSNMNHESKTLVKSEDAKSENN